MKSYLGLVREYERVHKKKNRLTVICIAISVMLVTTIFSLADISVKAQIEEGIQRYGNWHLSLNGISDEVAGEIAARNDVAVSSWIGLVDDVNPAGETQDVITYQGKEVFVQGSSEALAAAMNLTVNEGSFPANENEALLDRQGLEQFGLALGDSISLPFPDGQERSYTITGTFGEFSFLQGTDSHGLFLSEDGIRALPDDIRGEFFYVQFARGSNIRAAIRDIQERYSLTDEQVSPNVVLLGLMGQSDDSALWQLYLTAIALFILVTLAGVFMIAGSFNMSVLERTRFFGLLRCLGASKKQIKRYIRLEGLRYSLRGIPLGLLAGCAITCTAVLVLNMVEIGSVLPEMGLSISLPGLLAGCVMGFLVVMLASGAPAKNAAAVSPQAAVSGNLAQGTGRMDRAVSESLRIDTAMGVHHAFASKKNLVLTAGSFALSVILLLSFTVLTDFIAHAAKPLKPFAPDISVTGGEDTSTFDRSIIDELKAIPGIRNIYGRMFARNIAATSKGQAGTVTLISYDEPQFRFAEEMLLRGKIDDVESGNGVLVDYVAAERNQWAVGDTITLDYDGKMVEFPISGILSDTPFQAVDGEWLVICSEATFTDLTSASNYTIIDMQVDEDVAPQVRSVISPDMRLLDNQKSNEEVRAAYYTMAVFVYGFLFVVALVAFINILNMVSAGVSNRMGNYGVMRAVGMSGKQLKKIITAEAATYAVTGCVTGGVLGLLLHRTFYTLMITSNWGESWSPPLLILCIIVLAALLTTVIAVISPAKKIEGMSIVSVVNAE